MSSLTGDDELYPAHYYLPAATNKEQDVSSYSCFSEASHVSEVVLREADDSRNNFLEVEEYEEEDDSFKSVAEESANDDGEDDGHYSTADESSNE